MQLVDETYHSFGEWGLDPEFGRPFSTLTDGTITLADDSEWTIANNRINKLIITTVTVPEFGIRTLTMIFSLGLVGVTTRAVRRKRRK